MIQGNVDHRTAPAIVYRWILALLLLAFWSPNVKALQETPIQIQHAPRCADCQWQLGPTRDVGDYVSSDFWFGRVINAASSGPYLVLADIFRHQVHVLNKTNGSARVVGQDGEGPGEFRSPMAVAAHDSVVYVADPSLRRISVFSVKGQYESSIPFPQDVAIPSAMAATPQWLAVATAPIGSDTVLHLIDRDSGERVSGFVVPGAPDYVAGGQIHWHGDTRSLWFAVLGAGVPEILEFGLNGRVRRWMRLGSQGQEPSALEERVTRLPDGRIVARPRTPTGPVAILPLPDGRIVVVSTESQELPARYDLLDLRSGEWLAHWEAPIGDRFPIATIGSELYEVGLFDARLYVRTVSF